MRITKLIAALVVAGLTFAACQQDDDYVLPSLSVDTQTLAFTDAGASSLPLSLTATREWSVRSKPEWITVSPTEKGPASTEPQELTIFAAPNESYNQEGEIVFTIGLMKVAVAVSQPGAKGEIPVGSGTLEDPYTITGVLKYIATLGADVNSPQAVYVKGVIAGITEPFAAQYGNATFTMKEADSDGSTVFTFYRGIYLGNKKWKEGDTQIKEGDEVVICGTVVNFKGNTPETATGKAYVYSLNGETQGTGGGGSGSGDAGTPSGTGTQADPYNVAAARSAVANLTWTSTTEYQATEEVYVKGKISKIASKGTFGESGDYGNASFYISDDGSESSAQFYCFRILYLGNVKYSEGTDIKVGDEVVVCGKLMNYQGKTPETASGAYLFSLTSGSSSGGGSGSDVASGDGTEASPYNPAGAAAAVANLTWTSNTEYQSTEVVFIKGKISEIASKGTFSESGDYGNASFYITEDGSKNGTKFYVFRTLYLGNAKYTSGTDIKVGDVVIIKGKLMNYKGNTPETVANESYIYSLNGQTE